VCFRRAARRPLIADRPDTRLHPVIGYADDATIFYVVLRTVVRAAGPGVVENHWPGSPEGLGAVRRLLSLPPSE
jgi:uncharacterized membrane protein YkvA (DUF1232 family)